MYKYRTEDFGGEKYRDPVEVLAFETYGLGNSDAVEYMLEHWIEPGSLFSEGEDLLKEDPSEDRTRRFFSACLERIREKTGKTLTFGLWLADFDTVVDYYRGINIDAYNTESGVVLDDLGYDGMFVGFEAPIFPVQTWTRTIEGFRVGFPDEYDYYNINIDSERRKL